MYPILKYMWSKENYRESIKVTRNKCPCCQARRLAKRYNIPCVFIVFIPSKTDPNSFNNVLFQHLAYYASENLEAMNPPLFLRFLNLLMNDAIFLLDEAIQVKHSSMQTAPINI